MADTKSPMPGFSTPNLNADLRSKHDKGAYTKDQQTQGAKSVDSPNGGKANFFKQSHKGK